jgi:hypothetical protein
MCNCKEEEKTGTTSVMCCNICGMPDDPDWNVNQWIRVEDRLPEINQNCAVYINGGKTHKYFRWARFNGGNDWHGDGGHMMSHCYPNGLHNITHWIPLPKVPESILNNVYISEVKR